MQRVRIAVALLAGLFLWLLFKPRHSPKLEVPAPGAPAYRQRLVAVGDLHGDIDNAKTVLRMAGILDDTSDSWAAGRDILVQTGDIVDRGAYALDIYRLMQQLRSQAHSAGGRVVSILGNHEVMNALSDWRYVSSKDIQHWGGSERRRRDMSVDGWLGQEWLANYTVTARVAMQYTDTSYAFTHGSLRPSYGDLTPYPSRINELGASLLERALTPPLAPPYPPNPYSGLPKGTTQAEAGVYDSGGPLWWRGLAEANDKTVCAWAEELKEKIGVRRVIGGHTPDFDKIVHRCDGAVIIIDTAYGGVLSALEIVYTLTPVGGAKTSSPLKGTYTEREEVHAVYQRRRERIAVVEREVVV